MRPRSCPPTAAPRALGHEIRPPPPSLAGLTLATDLPPRKKVSPWPSGDDSGGLRAWHLSEKPGATLEGTAVMGSEEAGQSGQGDAVARGPRRRRTKGTLGKVTGPRGGRAGPGGRAAGQSGRKAT